MRAQIRFLACGNERHSIGWLTSLRAHARTHTHTPLTHRDTHPILSPVPPPPPSCQGVRGTSGDLGNGPASGPVLFFLLTYE